MNAIIALAKKDLLLMLRDKFALFWIFAFPLMFALFFGAIYGNGGGEGGSRISLAVVDEDASDLSLALVERLGESSSLELELLATAAGAVPYDAAAARAAVQKGRLNAFLRIPAGYGENPWALFGAGDDDAPKLEIGIDPARTAEAGFLQGVLIESVFGAVQGRLFDSERLTADLADVRAELAESSGLGAGQTAVLTTFLGALESFSAEFDMTSLNGDGAAGGGGLAQPFVVVDVSRDRTNRPRSAFDVTFPQALVWGLMSVAMGFAITFVRERTSGTLLRLRMAPIGRFQLLAGRALASFVGCIATMSVILAIGFVALGVRFDSLPLLFVAMVATSICFTGLMMTVSVLGKTEPAVAGAAWGLMMPFAMLGGGMIPLMAMPDWLAQLSVVSPFRWAILAVEGATWRGFDAGDSALPCLVLVSMGVAFFALGVGLVRRIEG